MQIAIAIIGAVSDDAIATMTALVWNVFNADVAATAEVEMPQSAFSRSRVQY